MFKLIGAIAGYYALGLLGGFLGFIVGWVIDRIRNYGAGGANPLQNALRQTVFLETLFIAMGRLAKADGRVSEAEIANVENLMHKLGMTADHRQRAIALFKQGVAPETDYDQVCARFMSVCGQTRNLRELLLVYLITLGLADGHLHPAEESVLATTAKSLGYDQASFQRLMDMVRNQSHFAQGADQGGAALDDAYKALGIGSESSDAEVKRAYRKLMSQYHPDKLIGQGMPDDMIAVATEKTKEIQVAYDLIQKSRGH